MHFTFCVLGRRKTIRCQQYRVARLSRKYLDSKWRPTSRSQRRQWLRHHRLQEIRFQLPRQKSTKTSTAWNHKIIHGTKIIHQKKVSFSIKYKIIYIHIFFLTFFLDKFYSSSDSDSDDEIERKIHVEIKPLNGTAPISASVDELRATVENLSLSPIGALSVINERSFLTAFNYFCCFHIFLLLHIFFVLLTLELFIA